MGIDKYLGFDCGRVRAQFRQWSSRLVRLGVSEQTVVQWSKTWMEIFNIAAAISRNQIVALNAEAQTFGVSDLLQTNLSFDDFSVVFRFDIRRIQVYLTQTGKQVDRMPVYVLNQWFNRVPVSEMQSATFDGGPIVVIDWGVSELRYLMVSGFQVMADYLDDDVLQDAPLYLLTFDEVLASGALQTAYEQCMYTFLRQTAQWVHSNDPQKVEYILNERQVQDLLVRLNNQQGAIDR